MQEAVLRNDSNIAVRIKTYSGMILSEYSGVKTCSGMILSEIGMILYETEIILPECYCSQLQLVQEWLHLNVTGLLWGGLYPSGNDAKVCWGMILSERHWSHGVFREVYPNVTGTKACSGVTLSEGNITGVKVSGMILTKCNVTEVALVMGESFWLSLESYCVLERYCQLCKYHLCQDMPRNGHALPEAREPVCV